MELLFRVNHIDTKQGLWYDFEGNYTGLIHKEFDFCTNKELPMPFDPQLVGWLSATKTLEELFFWFTREDILKLQTYNWRIHVFEAQNVRSIYNHFIIEQSTSKLVGVTNLI